MNSLFIICVDDQPEVLNALEQDLKLFDEKFNVEVCDSAAEAIELMDEIDQHGDYAAVVITDQVMPELTGVDLLSKITGDERFHDTQKILLTGLATHEDTIQAINTGGIDHYIEKPWSKEEITNIIKKCLTQFILTKGIEYQSYMEYLDQDTLYKSLKTNT